MPFWSVCEAAQTPPLFFTHIFSSILGLLGGHCKILSEVLQDLEHCKIWSVLVNKMCSGEQDLECTGEQVCHTVKSETELNESAKKAVGWCELLPLWTNNWEL